MWYPTMLHRSHERQGTSKKVDTFRASKRHDVFVRRTIRSMDTACRLYLCGVYWFVSSSGVLGFEQHVMLSSSLD